MNTIRMAKILFAILSLLFVLVAGCAVTTQITNTSRSSIEQELLVSSLERALNTLDTQRLTGATVAVDFYGLTPDKDFAKEFVTAWLQAHRVQIATNPKEAHVRLKVFAPVLAVDQAQSFIGTPSFTVPLIGLAIPEIALFKDVRHSGHAALDTFTIDEDSGKFLDQRPRAIGHSRYDDYTVFILLHFTRSDMEKRKWDWEPG